MSNDQFASALQRVRSGDASEGDWNLLAVVAATGGAVSHIDEILTHRHAVKGDGGSFAYELAFHLLSSGRIDTVRALAQGFGQQSAFWGIFTFVAGLAPELLLREESRLVRQGAFHATQAEQSVFSRDPRFPAYLLRMQIQANLLEPGDLPVAPLLAHGLAGKLPQLPSAEPASIVMAACDENYLQSYGPRLAESFHALSMNADLLVVVINPRDDGVPLRSQLAERFPRLAFAFASGPENPQYYASARFLFAAPVLAAYARPLVIVDADTLFRPGFKDVVGVAHQHSVGLAVVEGAVSPSLRVTAAVVTLLPDAAANGFLARVQAFLSTKMREVYTPWMVDQAALYHAMRLSPEGGVTDLNALLPSALQLPGIVVAEHVRPLDEREAERGMIGRFQIRFDEHRCPLFTRE